MAHIAHDDYRVARRFARAAQVATWLLALGWCAIIVAGSGAFGGDLPLAARLPDLIAAGAFAGLMVVGAAVVHAVLAAAMAVFRIAGDAQALEHHVRVNTRHVTAAVPAEPVIEPRIVEPPVARPIAQVMRRPLPA